MEKNKSFIYSDFPVVIKNKIRNWKMLKYTKEDWCSEFGEKLLQFRQGTKTFSQEPLWEHLCETKNITLRNFFELSEKQLDRWLYFDYKYMKDVFHENKKLIDEIKWTDLELPGVCGEDSALWIGNEGAHTPCHMDTYGCNFVAQIFGRKLWILIPPEENETLKPVRVPYEESSIYSAYNFYTPDQSLLKIKNAFKIVLSPGDVLYVPHHWWHYVENLEVSISINVWIPLGDDHESRLEESLVQHYISSICKNLTEKEAKQLINPNEYSLLTEPCSLNIIEKCIISYKKFKQENDQEVKEAFEMKSKFTDCLIEVSQFDIESYVSEKSKTHNYSLVNTKKILNVYNQRTCLVKALINWYCQPSNIALAKNAVLHQFENF